MIKHQHYTKTVYPLILETRDYSRPVFEPHHVPEKVIGMKPLLFTGRAIPMVYVSFSLIKDRGDLINMMPSFMSQITCVTIPVTLRNKPTE
jgi:hypothetical protein